MTSDLHLAPRFRMIGAISLLPPVCIRGVGRNGIAFVFYLFELRILWKIS